MNKKYISLVLAGLMCFSSITPVFAYDLDSSGNSIKNVEYQNTEDEDYTNATNVFAELGSDYKVTIPKTIVLSGITKSANYYVKVSGDIAGYETVSVVPDSTVNLYTKNKDSQTGTITQDKTTWKVSDFNIDANGQVTAQDLTAGKWSGTFNFNINLESDDAPILQPETPVHTHIAASPVRENEITITYTTNGSYDEVTYCTDCNEELSRVKKTIDRFETGGLFDANNNLIKSWNEMSSYEANCAKLIIPNSVTNIKAMTFCQWNLTAVKIPNSVTSIENYAFGSCFLLTSITYNGTKAQWNAIEKDDGWDDGMSKYVVHCTDGDISFRK